MFYVLCFTFYDGGYVMKSGRSVVVTLLALAVLLSACSGSSAAPQQQPPEERALPVVTVYKTPT